MLRHAVNAGPCRISTHCACHRCGRRASNCAALAANRGCRQSGATCASGASTKARSAMPGCGNTSPRRCQACAARPWPRFPMPTGRMTLPPWASRSMSSGRAAHVLPRRLPASRSNRAISLNSSCGSSVVRRTATALKKGGCRTPPKGALRHRADTAHTDMPGHAASARKARAMHCHGAPHVPDTFAPSASRAHSAGVRRSENARKILPLCARMDESRENAPRWLQKRLNQSAEFVTQ